MPLSAIAGDNDPSARAGKWDESERVESITLGEADADTERITVRLLDPEPIIYEGRGGFDTVDGRSVTTYEATTLSHGFVFTSDGDLYIDNQYAGHFTRKDSLVFGSSRLWSNGVPCTMKPLTESQIRLLFDGGGMVYEPDGTILVHRGTWTVYLKPGGRGGRMDPTGGAFEFVDGMTVIRVEQGRLIVNGMDYGAIVREQTIKVCDGVVSVDREVRSPQAISRMRKMETGHTETKPNQAQQAGTGQPATSPKSESEGSQKPQPEAEGRSR